MNPVENPFDEQAEAYDRWYDEHHWTFQSEVFAIERLLPHRQKAVEIGVGTGRFAAAFNIRLGVDPSRGMLEVAKRRNIQAIQGVAESLPFGDESFELVLMVTTICFLSNIKKSLAEARRILSPGGHLVIGFIDRLSPLGKAVQEKKSSSAFYHLATFFSPEELSDRLSEASFDDIFFVQTLFNQPGDLYQIDPVKNGYGLGSFLVVRAVKY